MGSSLPPVSRRIRGRRSRVGSASLDGGILHPLPHFAGSPRTARAAGCRAWLWATAPRCHGGERAPFGTSGARWELGTSSKDGDARGDGATVPGGPWGPGSAVELGLNWKQVLGTSQRREWGCRGRGVRPGAGDGGVSGVHIWQRRGGRKHRIGSPPRPMLGRHRVPGGHITARCCAAVSGASSPPRAPHPPGSSPCASSAGRAGGDLRGPPLLQPQLPEPRVCLLPLCHYQLTPAISSPTSPQPLTPFLLLAAAPQLPAPGALAPLAAPAFSLAPWGREEGSGAEASGVIYCFSCPPPPQASCAFPQRRGWAGRLLPGTQPAPAPRAEKSRERRRQRGRGLRELGGGGGGGMLTPTAGRR